MVWWQMPGVVAAYQFVAAPTFHHVLRNVAPSGGYPLTSASYPGWLPHSGARFNGSNQYLYLTVAPQSSWSILIRFSNITTGEDSNGSICGALASNDTTSILRINPKYTSARYFYDHYGRVTVNNAPTSGSLSVAGTSCYLNAVSDGTISQSNTGLSVARIGLGGVWLHNYGFGWFCGVDIQSVLIVSRPLSFAEVELASHQMNYCESNPAWNAWAPKRRYYYTAPTVAGAVGIYGKRAALRLPGGVRIEAVQ